MEICVIHTTHLLESKIQLSAGDTVNIFEDHPKDSKNLKNYPLKY